MANMIYYKHRTYVKSTAIRDFGLILEPLTSNTEFIDYIQDNLSSTQPILIDQQTS